MFTEEYIQNTIIKELLPCNIGDKIYTIYKSYGNRYTIDFQRCEGFIIEEYGGKLEIRPAYNTWDGWCSILDHGRGYYTDKEEALKKIKELNELEELKKQNKWIENL